MEVFIDGRTITSRASFFDALLALDGVPAWAGRNLDALWDTLTGLLETPIVLNWTHAEVSARVMGSDFDEIVSLMRQAEAEGPAGLFKLQLLSSAN